MTSETSPTEPMTPEPLTLMVALLSRLRRKGARLDPDGDGFVIVYPGERRRALVAGPGEPVRQATATLVLMAKEKGWLTATDGSTGALKLTEAGALMAQRGAGPVPSRPRPAEPTKMPSVARARAALTPLARLRQMRDGKGGALLTSAQVEAGERLAADFVKGQMMPRVTANWDRAALGFGAERSVGNAVVEISDGAASAQERVRRALAAAGPEFADLLLDVCCLETGLEAVEKRRAWPPGAGRVVLALGLDLLQRHYGIVAAGPARGRTGHWGAEDFRPTGAGGAGAGIAQSGDDARAP